MTPKVLLSSMAKLCRGANEEVCEGMLVYEFMTRSARMCKNCLERANVTISWLRHWQALKQVFTSASSDGKNV